MDLDISCRLLTLDRVPNSPVKTISKSRRLLLIPLWLLARLWTGTWRFEVSPEARAHLADTSSPTILLFWHNRLFLLTEIYRRFRLPRPTYGLVSASNDGAWLAAVLALAGVRTVRGSSSRRGREALFELAAKVSAGNDLAITPDGPRGPAYSFAPGAAILVRRTGARLLLIGSSVGGAWRLRSWDRFILPRPFSKIVIKARLIPAESLPRDRNECVEALRSLLNELNEE